MAEQNNINETTEEKLNTNIKLMIAKLLSGNIKNMDADKPVTIKEKDSIMKVFNELVNAILKDQAIMQKIAKRKSGDEEED